MEEKPDWIIVVGDVNSTVACALVGAKLWISVAHLEAGLRSGDRSMPEEINRLVTDAIASLLWTPSSDGDRNLLREGIAAERIDRIGNIMIDSFELLAPKIRTANVAERFSLEKLDYGVVTLHRPSNVDEGAKLALIVAELRNIAARLPLIFSVHPRTRQRLGDFGLLSDLEADDGITLTEPLSYIEFMSLVLDCRLALTDSGGIQEETTYLGIPCLTLRDNTERPVTVTAGTNRLVKVADLEHEVDHVLQGPPRARCHIEFWDGKTAARAAQSLKWHAQGG
jgi:UDP-N-acetylglucosamine 2-epimerase (non-hydrolysing)